MDLEGKVAIVTGASAGIGRAYVLALAGAGASHTALASRPDAKPGVDGKPPTPEVLGPAVICLAQQTAETLTGQVLHTDDYQQSWP
jgi:NAD(P)-dependent dehydrogenase (short-subunit alcohol dehydrogenase family)